MQRTLLIVASTLGLALGASQLAAAAPLAHGAATKSAIDTAAPVESVGYYYRRRPYYQPYRYNY
jgi:hypothetical protein